MEEGLAKVPKLDLAQHKFVLTKETTSPTPNASVIQSTKEKILAGISLDSKPLLDFDYIIKLRF